MLTIRKASLIAIVMLAGCATEIRNADAPPGGLVTTVDKTQNTMLGWMQVTPSNKAPGVEHWTRMRVIAPAGATECRTQDGPQDEGKPDAQGAVMLTGREGARSVQIVCDTPQGVVKRTVNASVYAQPIPPDAPPDIAKRLAKRRDTHVLPPLVHVDPGDPGAEARWAAIGAELCPEISERVFGFVCKPGMLEAFKAADLNEAL